MNEHYENIRKQLNKVQELATKFCEYYSANDLYEYASTHEKSIKNIYEVLLDEKTYIDLKIKNDLEKYEQLSNLRNLLADLSDLLNSLLINIDNQDNYLINQYAKGIKDRLNNFNY